MSTKLFNGYKINPLSMIEFKEFIDNVKERLHKVFKSNYKDTLNYISMDLIDNIVTGDYLFGKTGDASYIEEQIVDILKKSYCPGSIINDFNKMKSNVTLEEGIKCFNYKYLGSVRIIAKDTIRHRVFVCNTKQICTGPAFDFQNELVILPSDDKILLLAFGDKLENILQQILQSKKKIDREFRNKYGFEYYGYWNNVDKPDNLSYKKWNARGDEWESVLAPDYIPSKHGICSEIISQEQFFDEMDLYFLDKSNFSGDLIPPETRANTMALNIVRKNWLNQKNVNLQNAFDMVEQFEELKKTGTFDVEISSIEEDLKKLLPVVDKNAVNKKLMDYAPNYKKAHNLK